MCHAGNDILSPLHPRGIEKIDPLIRCKPQRTQSQRWSRNSLYFATDKPAFKLLHQSKRSHLLNCECLCRICRFQLQSRYPHFLQLSGQVLMKVGLAREGCRPVGMFQQHLLSTQSLPPPIVSRKLEKLEKLCSLLNTICLGCVWSLLPNSTSPTSSP